MKLEMETLIEAYSSKATAGLDLFTSHGKFDACKSLEKSVVLRLIAHPDGTP